MAARQEGSFESFRAQRVARSPRRARQAKPEGRRGEILERLDQAELLEKVDRNLRAEMEEFFDESARLAGSVLRRLTDDEKRRIEQKVLAEVREFFAEATRRAADLARRLRMPPSHAPRGGGEAGTKPSSPPTDPNPASAGSSA